jgi:hypothetical protein
MHRFVTVGRNHNVLHYYDQGLRKIFRCLKRIIIGAPLLSSSQTVDVNIRLYPKMRRTKRPHELLSRRPCLWHLTVVWFRRTEMAAAWISEEACLKEVSRGRMSHEVKVALTPKGVGARWRSVRGAAGLEMVFGLLRRWTSRGFGWSS